MSYTKLGVAYGLLALLLVAGCKQPTLDELADEHIALLNELADTLATVKDKTSAEAARPKLREIRRKIKLLKARASKIEHDSKQTDAVRERCAERLRQANERIRWESARIQAIPELNDDLQHWKPEPPDPDEARPEPESLSKSS